MPFQIEPYDLAWALGKDVAVGHYTVRVAAVHRDAADTHRVHLLLEIAEGYHDGTPVPYEFEEPHPEQNRREFRKCLRTLFAFGIVPGQDGVYDYSLEDLIGRKCDAGIASRMNGVPRVWHDGLEPIEQ